MVCCCKSFCTSSCLHSSCKHCSICKPWRKCYSCKKCCSCSCYDFPEVSREFSQEERKTKSKMRSHELCNENSLKRKASWELRNSVLYTNCDCSKRNGLQDDCRMSMCQGKKDCLTCPEPDCLPAKHQRARNERYEREIDRHSEISRHRVKQEESHNREKHHRPAGWPRKYDKQSRQPMEKHKNLSDCECHGHKDEQPEKKSQKAPSAAGTNPQKYINRPHPTERCFEVCEVDPHYCHPDTGSNPHGVDIIHVTHRQPHHPVTQHPVKSIDEYIPEKNNTTDESNRSRPPGRPRKYYEHSRQSEEKQENFSAIDEDILQKRRKSIMSENSYYHDECVGNFQDYHPSPGVRHPLR